MNHDDQRNWNVFIGVQNAITTLYINLDNKSLEQTIAVNISTVNKTPLILW